MGYLGAGGIYQGSDESLVRFVAGQVANCVRWGITHKDNAYTYAVSLTLSIIQSRVAQDGLEKHPRFKTIISTIDGLTPEERENFGILSRTLNVVLNPQPRTLSLNKGPN